MNVGIPDRYILDRYLKNTCTEEERKLVDDWYDQLNIDVSDESLISEEDRAAVKAEVWEGVSGNMQPAKPFYGRYRIWWQAIAAAAVFVLVWVTIHWWENNAHRPIFALQQASGWDTTTAKAGNIVSLTLEDGTRIWLKAGSAISYPQHFDGDTRNVNLIRGEAFLDVAKDESRPFILTSGQCVTRVLGTTFNVRRYERRNEFAVSVLSGKVQVATPTGDKKILEKGEEVVQAEKGNYLVKEISPAAMRGEWKKGEMIFRQKRFAEIAAELEDYYGVTVTFKYERLADLRITGRFSYRQSPDDILRSLCTVNGNSFSKQSSNYYTISE